MPHRLTLRWHDRSPDLVLRMRPETVPPTLSVYVIEAIPRPSAERLNALVRGLAQAHDDPDLPAALLLLGSELPPVWTAGIGAHNPRPLNPRALAALCDPPATGPWWTPTREAVTSLWCAHPGCGLHAYLILESLTEPPYEWAVGLPVAPRRLTGGAPPPVPRLIQVETGGRAFPTSDGTTLRWDRFLADLGSRRPPPAGPEPLRIRLPPEVTASGRLPDAAQAAGWRLEARDGTANLVHPAFRSSAATGQMDLLLLPEAARTKPDLPPPVFADLARVQRLP